MNLGRVQGIAIPRWYRGVRPNHQGAARRYHLIAFDTETVKGYPYTMQLTNDGVTATLRYLSPRQFFPALIRYLEPEVHRMGPNAQVVLMGFNLAYDLPALLYPHAKRFKDGHFTIRRRGGVSIEVFYSRIPFAKIRFRIAGRSRVVWVIDAFTYVWTSLERAAQIYELPMAKLKRPKFLGQRVLRGKDFEAYAKSDVLTTWHLGQKILEWHRQFDLRLCVSIAQFAGRVFQHGFLRHRIRKAPEPIMRAALLSYHGGKNGFYLKRPGWIARAREYDLKSAYPWAMAQLPSMREGSWQAVSYVHPDAEGFYCISGEVQPCKYPALFDHDFHPLRMGRVKQVWVTSYELREALRTKELKLHQVTGYIWIPTSRDRPLRKFVRHFYRLKRLAKTTEEREVYKLILNSLYGKFIQLNPNDDGTERPGSLFHPVLASWITGLVRARMHRLEHDAEALHTATDAVHTTRELSTSRGLGGLELAQDGPALLLRNKVYLHFDQKGQSCKYALHGIHTTVDRFWRKLLKGSVRYRITHLLRPKEAIARRDRPLRPVYKSYRVTLRLPQEEIPRAAQRYFRMRAVPSALWIAGRQASVQENEQRKKTLHRREGQLRRMEREFLLGYEAYLREKAEQELQAYKPIAR